MDQKKMHEMANDMRKMALELAEQIKSQESIIKAEIGKHLPEMLPEYDALMADILAGRKSSQDMSEFFAKYHHIVKTKQDNTGLNTK